MTDGYIVEGRTLYVIATPIGNMGDITGRAVEVLKSVDLIAAEDTRNTQKILQRYGIEKPIISYHEQNELSRVGLLVEKIKSGLSVGLVSDAGTPCLSDPGFRIVRECRREGLAVIPVPGASAVLSALSVSGLPSNGFLYVGFLPPKTAARVKFFREHIDFSYSIILYESSHRIEKCVHDIMEVMGGERVISVHREMTKKFETHLVGKVCEVGLLLKGKNLKGEFVVIISPGGYVL